MRNSFPAIHKRLLRVIKSDGNDRPQRVGVTVARIELKGSVDVGSSLLEATNREQQTRTPRVELSIRVSLGNPLQLFEGVRREDRLVVEGPLHRIARPNVNLLKLWSLVDLWAEGLVLQDKIYSSSAKLLRLTAVILLLSHWFACVYYALTFAEGFSAVAAGGAVPQ